MGEPFRGKTAQEFSGRARVSQAEIKLDAAKESLLEHLSSLGSPSRVVLVEFTSRASVIFDGLSNNRDELQRVLDTLEPDNGTDIAVALNTARRHIQLKDIPRFSVLVISDGLSNLEPAEEEAQQLARNTEIINVILIDPTDEGESVARAIIATTIYGTVSAVTSAQALSDKTGQYLHPPLPPPLKATLPPSLPFLKKPPTTRVNWSFLLFLIIIGLLGIVAYSVVSLKLMTYPKKVEPNKGSIFYLEKNYNTLSMWNH